MELELYPTKTPENPIFSFNKQTNELRETKQTIVTMFYDIREKEKDKLNNKDCILNRNIHTYCELAKQFILKLPYNLIIFTDNEDVISIVENERIKNSFLKDKTYIYKKKLEEMYYYNHLFQLEELQKKYTIHNGSLEHETPLYIIVNNNKFECIKNAIELNPFQSTHFIWLDFGITHVALNPEKIHDWINHIPDKIRQMCINPYIENVDNKQMFQTIYHHISGGLFSGSKENLLLYCDLFKQKTEQIYNEGWYQIDEAVMTMVQRENADLFDLYYGDYIGIITNYLSPIHNIELIISGSQKCIDHNKTYFAYHILNYCNSYFIQCINEDKNKNEDKDKIEERLNETIYKFISQHIIVDYYHNNKCLTNEVIQVINGLLVTQDSRQFIIKQLLEVNNNNLNFYENKNLIDLHNM